jgi:hypothetical protein
VSYRMSNSVLQGVLQFPARCPTASCWMFSNVLHVVQYFPVGCPTVSCRVSYNVLQGVLQCPARCAIWCLVFFGQQHLLGCFCHFHVFCPARYPMFSNQQCPSGRPIFIAEKCPAGVPYTYIILSGQELSRPGQVS